MNQLHFAASAALVLALGACGGYEAGTSDEEPIGSVSSAVTNSNGNCTYSLSNPGCYRWTIHLEPIGLGNRYNATSGCTSVATSVIASGGGGAQFRLTQDSAGWHFDSKNGMTAIYLTFTPIGACDITMPMQLYVTRSDYVGVIAGHYINLNPDYPNGSPSSGLCPGQRATSLVPAAGTPYIQVNGVSAGNATWETCTYWQAGGAGPFRGVMTSSNVTVKLTSLSLN